MGPPNGGSKENPANPSPRNAEDYDRLLEDIAEEVGFPRKFMGTGIAKLRVLSSILASLPDDNFRTPYPIQKFCVHHVFDQDEPPILSPISNNKAGPHIADIANCIPAMERAGLLVSRPTELTGGTVKSYRIAPEWESVVPTIEDWEEKAEVFFNKMDLRRPFQEVNPKNPDTVTTHYDKMMFYPKIFRPDTIIGCDFDTIKAIQRDEHEFEVQSEVREYLMDDPPWSLKEKFDPAYWPVVNLLYGLASEWKHFKRGDDAGRKFNLPECHRQAIVTPDRVEGDAGLYVGWLDAWLERKNGTPPRSYLLREGLTTDERLRIEYDGPLSIPPFEIYNYNVGAVGVLTVDEEPVLNALAMLGLSRLPKQVVRKQDEDKQWKYREQVLRKLQNLENIVEDERDLVIQIFDELIEHEEVSDEDKTVLAEWKERAKKGKDTTKETVEGVHALGLILELGREHPEFWPLIGGIIL